jgi:hypothetical protein
MERRAAEGSVETRVVPKFGERKETTPLLRRIMHSATQEHFDTLIHALRLAVRLWMIGSGELELRPELLEQVFPERACEDTITVRDNRARHSMKLNH